MIADRSMEVVDPLTGGNRRIFAGQPVPADLVEAYEEGGEEIEYVNVEGSSGNDPEPEDDEEKPKRASKAKAK